jgi:hypothetical protein
LRTVMMSSKVCVRAAGTKGFEQPFVFHAVMSGSGAYVEWVGAAGAGP